MADKNELKKTGGGSHYEGMSWAVIVALFCIPFTQPLGLLMLFVKLWSGGEKKDDRKLTASEQRQIQEAARKYTPVDRPVIDVEPAEAVSAPPRTQNPSRRPAPAAKPQSAEKPAPPEKKQPAVKEAARSLTRTPRTSRRKAKWLKIAGGAALVLGTIGLSETVSEFLLMGDLESLWSVIQAAIIALAGGMALFSGFRMSKRQRRNEQYLALMGQKDTVAFDQLSRMMGLPPHQITRDLRDMWDRGDLPEGAFLDLEQGRYFASFQAAEDLSASRRAAEAAPPPQSEEGWSGMLRGIRRVNDTIADPALSARIDRIADLAGRILRLAEEEPEKKNQVRGFLDYYLPTTRKLLDAYASFERAGLDSENLKIGRAHV